MKERIKQDAMREIGRRGLKFSVRELASGLGISTKTLYQHYESKEALIADIVEQAIIDMKAQESRVLGDASLSAARKLRDSLVNLPKGFAFTDIRVLQELKTSYPTQWRAYDEYMNQGWDNIRGLIRDGIAEGELRPFDPDTFIHAYIGVLYRMMDVQAAAQSALTMDKALGPTVDLLLYGILSDNRKEERL